MAPRFVYISLSLSCFNYTRLKQISHVTKSTYTRGNFHTRGKQYFTDGQTKNNYSSFLVIKGPSIKKYHMCLQYKKHLTGTVSIHPTSIFPFIVYHFPLSCKPVIYVAQESQKSTRRIQSNLFSCRRQQHSP